MDKTQRFLFYAQHSNNPTDTEQLLNTSDMEKKEVKRMRVWYMYFYRNGKRERSPEYPSLTKFVEACGKWCDNHPDDYQLCSRIATIAE